MHEFDFMWFIRLSSQKTEWANWIFHELLNDMKKSTMSWLSMANIVQKHTQD